MNESDNEPEYLENESPQPQTGGLKLMTVFVIVLALHVVVIGGIGAYQFLFRTGDSVADLAKQEHQAVAAKAEDDTESTSVGSQVVTRDTPEPSQPMADAEQTSPAEPSSKIAANNAPESEPVKPSLVAGKGKEPSTAQMVDAAHGGEMRKPASPATDSAAPESGKPMVTGKTGTATAKTDGMKVTTPAKTEIAKSESPKPESNAAKTYAVKSGDTLGKIAAAHDVSIGQLKTANKLTDNGLKIGQKLKIPSAKNDEPTKVASTKEAKEKKTASVEKKDVVINGKNKQVESFASVVAGEKGDAPKVTKTSASNSEAKPSSGKSYIVVKGDTVSKIAKQFGTSSSAILSANGMSESDAKKLAIGAKLRIPGKKSAESEGSTTAAAKTAKPAGDVASLR